MKKIVFIIAIMFFLNATFTVSTYLKDLHTIKNISLNYEDIYGNNRNKNVQVDYKFTDPFLVFSENRKNKFLKNIKLKNAKHIHSLDIQYINKNNKSINKSINIDARHKSITKYNLYLYQDKDYIYSFNNLLSQKNLDKKDKKKHSSVNHLDFEPINESRVLKISYHEDDKDFYLFIEGCETSNKCDEPIYKKKPNNKIVVFKFKLHKNHTQQLKNTKFIKRIEVGFDKKRVRKNHLVIESKEKKIRSITRMYFENNILKEYKKNRDNFTNKQFIYKIKFVQ